MTHSSLFAAPLFTVVIIKYFQQRALFKLHHYIPTTTTFGCTCEVSFTSIFSDEDDMNRDKVDREDELSNRTMTLVDESSNNNNKENVEDDMNESGGRKRGRREQQQFGGRITDPDNEHRPGQQSNNNISKYYNNFLNQNFQNSNNFKIPIFFLNWQIHFIQI
jgi:hypothetical protein